MDTHDEETEVVSDSTKRLRTTALLVVILAGALAIAFALVVENSRNDNREARTNWSGQSFGHDINARFQSEFIPDISLTSGTDLAGKPVDIILVSPKDGSTPAAVKPTNPLRRFLFEGFTELYPGIEFLIHSDGLDVRWDPTIWEKK